MQFNLMQRPKLMVSIIMILMVSLICSNIILYLKNNSNKLEQTKVINSNIAQQEKVTNSNIELQKKVTSFQNEILQFNQKLNVQTTEKNKDLESISEIIKFSIDTKQIHETGENLLNEISDRYKDGNLDLLDILYTTEVRIYLVNTFLNYQKKYTVDKLEVLYSMINIADEVLV